MVNKALIFFGMSCMAISSTSLASNYVEQDGKILIGQVPNHLVSVVRTSAEVSTDNTWYVRGRYNTVDFGYGIETVELGVLSSTGFKKIDQDIYKVSAFNKEDFIATIDPDGQYSNGCSLVDSESEWVVLNESHWCDPEFTLKRTMAYAATEPLKNTEPTHRKDRIENGMWADPGVRFEVIETDVYGVGPYKGYLKGTNKFAFEKVEFVTEPNPVNLKEVESVVYRLNDNEQLGFQFNSEYRSYQGYPRVQANEWRRRVSFTLEFLEVDSDHSIAYLVPDFWDGSLEFCPEASIEGQRCNLGYSGSVTVRFNSSGLEDFTIGF